jgi:hypothetical protein
MSETEPEQANTPPIPPQLDELQLGYLDVTGKGMQPINFRRLIAKVHRTVELAPEDEENAIARTVGLLAAGELKFLTRDEKYFVARPQHVREPHEKEVIEYNPENAAFIVESLKKALAPEPRTPSTFRKAPMGSRRNRRNGHDHYKS